MKKIIIEDTNLNEQIYYKSDVEADVFVEQFLSHCVDPDSIIITVKEMSREQETALRFLNESDWYIIRSQDPSSLEPVPELIVTARGEARGIL